MYATFRKDLYIHGPSCTRSYTCEHTYRGNMLITKRVVNFFKLKVNTSTSLRVDDSIIK